MNKRLVTLEWRGVATNTTSSDFLVVARQKWVARAARSCDRGWWRCGIWMDTSAVH